MLNTPRVTTLHGLAPQDLLTGMLNLLEPQVGPKAMRLPSSRARDVNGNLQDVMPSKTFVLNPLIALVMPHSQLRGLRAFTQSTSDHELLLLAPPA